MRSFLIIGLGRFGTALAVELCALGNEVLAMDLSEERVQAVADRVTHAVAGDGREAEVLRAVGARNMDCAVVATGSDVGVSALITLNLKEQGVPQVVGKANSADHRKVLEKIGADQVVFPEQEMALRLAQNLSNGEILNYIELSNEYSIRERRLPRPWRDRTLAELNIRAEYGLTIIAVRRGEQLIISPGADTALREGDSMLILGRDQDIERVETL